MPRRTPQENPRLARAFSGHLISMRPLHLAITLTGRGGSRFDHQRRREAMISLRVGLPHHPACAQNITSTSPSDRGCRRFWFSPPAANTACRPSPRLSLSWRSRYQSVAILPRSAMPRSVWRPPARGCASPFGRRSGGAFAARFSLRFVVPRPPRPVTRSAAPGDDDFGEDQLTGKSQSAGFRSKCTVGRGTPAGFQTPLRDWP